MKRREMMKQTMAFTLALSMLGGLACTVSASEPEKKDTWLSDEMVTITYARSESSMQPYNPDCATVQWIRENLGIDLQVSTYSDYDTKMNTLLAANQLPDLFSIWGNVNDVIGTGSLLELTDLIDQYAPHIQEDYKNIPELSRYKVEFTLWHRSEEMKTGNRVLCRVFVQISWKSKDWKYLQPGMNSIVY